MKKANIKKKMNKFSIKKNIFAEIGFGNKSFLSTEFETSKKEWRVNKFIFPKNLKEIYLRFWIFKRVLVISFFKGIFLREKKKNNLKIILGFGGTC